jgi:hypothetical protein
VFKELLRKSWPPIDWSATIPGNCIPDYSAERIRESYYEERGRNRALASALLVNREWSATVVPMLWADVLGRCSVGKESAYFTLFSFLDEEARKRLVLQGSTPPPALDKVPFYRYASFPREFDMEHVASALEKFVTHEDNLLLTLLKLLLECGARIDVLRVSFYGDVDSKVCSALVSKLCAPHFVPLFQGLREVDVSGRIEKVELLRTMNKYCRDLVGTDMHDPPVIKVLFMRSSILNRNPFTCRLARMMI